MGAENQNNFICSVPTGRLFSISWAPCLRLKSSLRLWYHFRYKCISTFVIGCCELWSLWEIGRLARAIGEVCGVGRWTFDKHLTNWPNSVKHCAKPTLIYLDFPLFLYFAMFLTSPFIIVRSFDVEIAKIFLGWIRMVGWKRMPIVLYAGAL